MRRTTLVLIAACLALWAFLAAGFMRSAAPTYDEPAHLASGYSYWVTGTFRFNIMSHPPFGKLWAAIPLLAMQPEVFREHDDFKKIRLFEYGDRFTFQNERDAEFLINSARAFSFATLSGLLAFLLWSWGRRLAGPVAGVGALGAAALSPVLISNLSLVLTDGMPAVLFFAVFWLLSAEQRSLQRWAAAGLCTGLALGSKYNALVLVGFVPGMFALEQFARAYLPERWSVRAPVESLWRGPLLWTAVSFATLVLCYGVRDFPLFLHALASVSETIASGHSTFFRGEHSTQGFWLYFPAALLLKNPIPVLLLALVGAGAIAARDRRAALWILLPPLGYFAVASLARVQIGIRHMLPVFPFLMLLAGLGVARLWQIGKAPRWAVALLALWTIGSVARAHPHQLAYFNELAGGPDGGYAWFSDSNLDWGQDLKALGTVVEELGGAPIYLSYFGSADPHAYGIRYVPVLMCCNVPRRGDPVDPAADGRVLLAVSATNRQGAYLRQKDTFDWLDARTPIRVLGHSIFVYDLTDDADGREKLARLVMFSTGDRKRAISVLPEGGSGS